MKIAIATLIGAMMLAGTGHASAEPSIAQRGVCPLGHITDDSNSACRGSDAAQWPTIDAGPGGGPITPCDEHNVGEFARTHHGPQKWRYWICRAHTSGSDTIYEWEEILAE